MAEERLGKLRAKLKEITEHIDEAEAAKTDASHANTEAIARLEKHYTELQSAQRRKILVEQELKDISERLGGQEKKLKLTTDQSEEIEATREELESKEAEGDERIEDLETSLKEMHRNVELNEARALDVERKVVVFTADIEKTQEKATKNENRVVSMEDLIKKHGEKLQELEDNEGEAVDRETISEEKVNFLTGQLKETELRADAAERMHAVLANMVVESENEIAILVKKTQDMEDLMLVMDDIADDPSYDISNRKGYKAGTPTSAKEMWEAKASAVEPEPERSESRSSSRAGRSTSRTPRDLSPEPEPKEATPEPEPEPEEEESEEESDEESEDEEEPEKPAPPPVKPAEEAKEKEEEESEEEESEEEDSEEEDSDED